MSALIAIRVRDGGLEAHEAGTLLWTCHAATVHDAARFTPERASAWLPQESGCFVAVVSAAAVGSGSRACALLCIRPCSLGGAAAASCVIRDAGMRRVLALAAAPHHAAGHGILRMWRMPFPIDMEDSPEEVLPPAPALASEWLVTAHESGDVVRWRVRHTSTGWGVLRADLLPRDEDGAHALCTHERIQRTDACAPAAGAVACIAPLFSIPPGLAALLPWRPIALLFGAEGLAENAADGMLYVWGLAPDRTCLLATVRRDGAGSAVAGGAAPSTTTTDEHVHDGEGWVRVGAWQCSIREGCLEVVHASRLPARALAAVPSTAAPAPRAGRAIRNEVRNGAAAVTEAVSTRSLEDARGASPASVLAEAGPAGVADAAGAAASLSAAAMSAASQSTSVLAATFASTPADAAQSGWSASQPSAAVAAASAASAASVAEQDVRHSTLTQVSVFSTPPAPAPPRPRVPTARASRRRRGEAACDLCGCPARLSPLAPATVEGWRTVQICQICVQQGVLGGSACVTDVDNGGSAAAVGASLTSQAATSSAPQKEEEEEEPAAAAIVSETPSTPHAHSHAASGRKGRARSASTRKRQPAPRSAAASQTSAGVEEELSVLEVQRNQHVLWYNHERRRWLPAVVGELSADGMVRCVLRGSDVGSC